MWFNLVLHQSFTFCECVWRKRKKQQREVPVLVFSSLFLLASRLTWRLLVTSVSSVFHHRLSLVSLVTLVTLVTLELPRQQSSPLFIQAEFRGGRACSCWVLSQFVCRGRVCLSLVCLSLVCLWPCFSWQCVECECDELPAAERTDASVRSSFPYWASVRTFCG